MQPSEWQRDKARFDVFLPTVKAIMGRIVFVEATVFEDEQHNTDLTVLVARGQRIAVRVRSHADLGSYGDEFTIRCKRPSGAKTELDKIADGWGDWFFYGFGNPDTKRLLQYVVIDLAAFRRRLITSSPPVQFKDVTCRDGSATFRAYKLSSIKDPTVAVKIWRDPTLVRPAHASP